MRHQKTDMKSKKKKKKLWLVPVCAAVIVVAAGSTLVWQTVRTREKDPDTQTAQKEKTADVVWNGKGYNYNDHLSNFLFMGVDNREKEETSLGQANAGQADAVYLASWDRVEDTVTLISIPRDTMTEIQIYGPGGTDLGTNLNHISLSYAYGDGSHESCRLTKDAVSNLFYGLPIQGYCSINLDGLPLLTESVGTLTVTVPNDSLEKVDPEFTKGAEVTLTPENTEMFVRYRDITVSQSAISRMERQQEFIRAFGDAAVQKFATDPGFITDLYVSLDPYMVTNMGTDQLVDIMQSVSAGGTRDEWTVPGEGVEGENYDEYYVDDEALYAKIIETFYVEAE